MGVTQDNLTGGGGSVLIAVHPAILVPATFPPFPLYTRRDAAGTLMLFRTANEPVYANTCDKARQGGHGFLYAGGEHLDACLDYMEQHLGFILAQDAVPPSHTAEWVYRLACRATGALIADPESLRDYNRVKALAEAIASLVRRHDGAEWAMVDSAPVAYSTPVHCVNVCVLLTSFAARVLEVEDEALLREIALGGVLHDLGKAMVPADILAKRAPLTRREFAQVRKHPIYGIKMTQPYLRRTFIAQCIIGQHHENASGDGYPDGRSGEGINSFARATRIADVFDALTSERPYGPALDEYRALNTMVTDMRSHFDLPMLRKFIRQLAAAAREESSLEVTTAEALSEVPSQIAEASPTEGTAPAQAATPTEAAEPTQLLSTPEQPATEFEPQPQTAPTPPRSPEAEVTLYAGLQERLDAIRAISDQGPRDASLMADVIKALKGALDAPLGQAMREQPAAASDAASADAEAQIEVAMVRGLFPLVWQLDEWIEKFSSSPHLTPDGMWLRADTLSCLHALREGVIEILQAHNVEVIEDLEALVPVGGEQAEDVPEAAVVYAGAGVHAEPAEFLPAASPSAPSQQRAESTAGPRRVKRVGFLYRTGQAAHVIEPARIVLYADLRKAG